MNKVLIVGLGNPGTEYDNTRHNIGFKILDEFANLLKKTSPLSLRRGAGGEVFSNTRLAFTAEGKIKNKSYLLAKPVTFMNLSGKAVNYYLQQEKIPVSNLLVVTDDIALPLGTIRLRPKGSDGGHNGLKSINEVLGTADYSRLRFGIGNEYPKGGQVDFVLGKWTNEEMNLIMPKMELATKAIRDFALMGIEKTMNSYNSK